MPSNIEHFQAWTFQIQCSGRFIRTTIQRMIKWLKPVNVEHERTVLATAKKIHHPHYAFLPNMASKNTCKESIWYSSFSAQFTFHCKPRPLKEAFQSPYNSLIAVDFERIEVLSGHLSMRLLIEVARHTQFCKNAGNDCKI